MFKRESEQPVRISFEEKREKRKRRSLRERLSNIPLRRRIEAVVLSAVTVMASLSIDWSKLLANAAEGTAVIESGKSIYSPFSPSGKEDDVTSLSTATVYVQKPTDKTISYTWEVYQNFTNERKPESGVQVATSSKTVTINSSSTADEEGFVACVADLSALPDGKKVVLRGSEKAGVVFKFTSSDYSTITYKLHNDLEMHYVKENDGSWSIVSHSGNCTKYDPEPEVGTAADLVPVKIDSGLPDGNKLALKENETHDFSELSWTDNYKRDPAIKEPINITKGNANLITKTSKLGITVADADSIGNGGTAIVTIGGDGVEEVPVTVNVVKFTMKGKEEDSVYTYTYQGKAFSDSDLFKATCGDDTGITSGLTTTFTGPLTKNAPLNVGTYDMTVTGDTGSDYAGLSYEKTFRIDPKPIDSSMFSVPPTVNSKGELQPIIGGEFGGTTLVDGVDFVAEITGATPGVDESGKTVVTYTITLTGKGNFEGQIDLTATGTSGAKLESVVDHIAFKNESGIYDGNNQTPEVALYDKDNNEIVNSKIIYTTVYSGTTRSGETIKDAPSIKDAGQYTAKIVGDKIYTGSSMTTPETEPYVLKPITLDDTSVTVTLEESNFEFGASPEISPVIKSVTYKGSTLDPAHYELKTGVDYPTAEGTHYVYITGRGNYEGEAHGSYTVFPSLTTAKVTFNEDKQGSMKADSSTLSWNYVWTCSNPIEYTGSPIEPDKVTVTIGDRVLTWNSTSTTNDMEKEDGLNNVDVSDDKAYFILTLPDGYAKKRIKVEFDIAPKSLDPGALELRDASVTKAYAYGEEITLTNGTEYYVQNSGGTPLIKDKDYNIEYKNNINAGTATITATGIGNYQGTSSKTFTINPITLGDKPNQVRPSVAAQELDKTGKGTEIDKSQVEFILNGKKLDANAFSPEDFELSQYKNNKNAWIKGTENIGDQPQVTLKGKRNLEGTYVLKFEIIKEKLKGLKWKLNTDSSIKGVLGEPGTTVNLSASPYNYVVDFDPSLPSRFVNLYITDDKSLDGGNYTRVYTQLQAGTNTIKVIGCGDYEGNEYTFTYEANRLNIKNCDVEQLTNGSSSTLPTFELTYKTKTLKAGTDYEATPVIKKDGFVYEKTTYDPGEYTAVFKGKGSYEGEKEATFHIGTPFDSQNVFVTMYGPAGTKTVGSENRLTYFGNNDPIFVLTSNSSNANSVINGPKYENGAYTDDADQFYRIKSWSISDSATRHKVGSTVTVTFEAVEGKGDWYNPKDSNGNSKDVSFTYTVVPGDARFTTGSIVDGLSIYIRKEDGTAESKQTFGKYGDSGDTIYPTDEFMFKYTTENYDPMLYVSYDPSLVMKDNKAGCATQSTDSGKPDLPEADVTYSKELVATKFNDKSLFNATKDFISADDTKKIIEMTPVSGGWLTTSVKIRVNYDFEAASLSDAKITLEPSTGEYAYTGGSVEPKYAVTMGSSPLSIGTDYELVGYSEIEKDTALPKPSEVTADTLDTIGIKLDNEKKPTKAGTYAFVIKGVEGGHYTGYNIAKFTIKTAKFTVALENPNFSVTYGADKKAPNESGDLKVTGVGGDNDVLQFYSSKEAANGNDGYYVDEYDASGYGPRTDAWVWVHGTGNYENSSDKVFYSIVANISSNLPSSPVLPKFSETNLELNDANLADAANPVYQELRLKNAGDLPYIGQTSTLFDPDTLTLKSTGGNNVEAKTLSSDWLEVTVTDAENESPSTLDSVGKKHITVKGKSGKPVTGSRTYCVTVLGDISTAKLTLYAGGVKVVKADGTDGTEIAYTGDSITVTPSLTFRGRILKEVDDYADNSDKTKDRKDVGSYKMILEGKVAAFYIGQLSQDFSIVYDLGKNIDIIYTGDNKKLSGHEFNYTGNPVVSRDNILVKVEGQTTTLTEANGDYDISFNNVTSPGTGSVTITGKSPNSKGKQTVNFYILGSNFKDGRCEVTLDNTPQVYDGTKKEPAVLGVKYIDKNDKERTLTKDQDYEVSYANNIDATSNAMVIINGKNGYSGTATKSFVIDPKDLTDSDVTVEVSDVPFGGKDSNGNRIVIEPTVKVTIGGKELNLKKDKDYEIVYPDNKTAKDYLVKNAGDADPYYTVTIKGKENGNYKGEVCKNDVKQLPGDLKNASIDPSLLESPYDGTNQKATILNKLVIKNGECILQKESDYKIVDPGNIISARDYQIKIEATTGDYAGTSQTFTYTVTPRSVVDNAGAFVTTLYDPVTGSSDPASFTWTGSQITPKVRLEDTGISNHDASVGNVWTNNDALTVNPMMNSFAVSYGTKADAGAEAGTVTLTASGNYTGTITKTFAIGQDISYASLTYDKTTAEYDGTPKSQTITVKYNGQTLTEGTAYESPVVYTWTGGETTAPTEVGSYIPVIKGKPDGGYYGQKQGTAFRIIAKNKTGDIAITFNGPQGEVEAADYTCHYNTKQQKPSINVYDTSSGTRVAIPAENYSVTYGNNVNAGSGYVYVALKGNYTGTAQEIFTIQPYDISNATLQFTEGENGVIKNVAESKFPYSPLFKLVGKDDNNESFEISYADSRLKQYLIVPDSSKVKKPGKGTFTVSGQGNLFGTTDEKEYEVYGRLSESNVSVKAPVYTGTKKDPEVTVTFAGEKLVLDTDYSLRIIPYDQTATGGGNVVVTGLGYFSGSVYTKYGEAGEVSTLELRGYSQQYVYSGSFAGPSESALYAADSEGNVIIPADKLNCTFTSSVDKTACVSAGATVTITSKATLDDGSVVDGPSGTYKIVARDISSCDVKQLSSDNYTGKPLTPPISVSYDRKTYSGTVVTGHDVMALVSGRDYSLSYSNNINPGTAVVTVTGKGNYTGSKRFMFTIKVADMATVTAKQSSGSTIVTWTARPHVTGYRVLYNTNGMTKVETTGTTVTLKDALPTTVGVQAIVKDSNGKVTYGTPKYVAVTK